MVIIMVKIGRLIVCLLLAGVMVAPAISQNWAIDFSASGIVDDSGELSYERPIPDSNQNGYELVGRPLPDARGLNTFYFDDVESANPYTTGQDAGASDWQRRTLGSASGSYSWDFGNGNYLDPGTGGLSWLISPDIVIPSAATDAELSFWQWRDFESNTVLYDGGNVKISTTGTGGPWTLLTPNGGYDGPADNGYDNPLGNEMVFGYNVAWENVTFDLTTYVGSTVNIRWDAGVDNYGTNDAGWRIDDILVSGNTPDTIGIPLTTGWNLVSIPVIQADTSINTVLNSIAGQWECAMWYDTTDPTPWESNSIYRPDAVDELWNIDHKMGVWVCVNADCTLDVQGVEPDYTRIPLYAGWNLVGYPSQTSQSAIDTLPLDIVDMVAVENQLNPYLVDETSDLSSVTMETGHGYWVHATMDSYWDIVSTTEYEIRQTAEFERMQGVLIRYPLGIPYNLIAEMAEDDIVYTIVANTATRDAAISNYGSNGVNLANCEWIIAASDSYWTRDYGPWWITDENGDFGIVDFPYNRPRPNDNDIPGEVASYLGAPLYYMSVSTTGGNYMTDGMGISVSTDLVLEENPGYTEAQIRQMHHDSLGIDNYHIVADVNGEYIKHIDCWAKYLDVDKIMIREVPAGHSQYSEIEAAVTYFESQTSAYGTPYEVYRVYTPNDEPYSNCLILNDKVLLPIMGGAWDAAAIASYEAAMPGYEVIGFDDSSAIWESTDALHCRTRGIPDQGMLYIQHYPVNGPQPASTSIEISANITAYSGSPLNTYELYWKLSTDVIYNVLPMNHVTRDHYRAFIPGQSSGATIQYYIHAADDSGRDETHPLIGDPDPNVFNIA